MNWHDLADAPPEEIIAWAADEPWCRAMAACGQDAGWHAEGDVWTHTRMVLGELPRLAAWPTLAPADRTRLTFTALLHDAGKPLTTAVDPTTGRTRSPKHAVRGEHLARRVLRDLGCPLHTRERIARLVRFHGRPAFLLEKVDPAREVVTLSWLADTRLLHLFALADTRGRRAGPAEPAGGTARAEENLHLFRLAAEEHGCFGRPYPFANDHARFLFFRPSSGETGHADLHRVPHEAFRCTVTLMSGLPGAGKDTWLAANRPGLPVVSLDGVRTELGVDATDDQGAVAQAAEERCRERLRAGRSFALGATNLQRQTRRRWIDLFADYGARVEIVYLEPPLPVILERNRRRERPVPERVIHKLSDRCEPPTWTDCHALRLVDT